MNRTGVTQERNSLCMNTLQREFFFIQYIQKSQPYGSLSCYNFHRVRGMKQIEGVEATQVGYANGNIANPTYQQVCTCNPPG